MRLPRIAVVSLFAVLVAVLFVSCAGNQRETGLVSRKEKVLHEWMDDGGPGQIAIRISLADQIAEITRGGRFVGWCYVATGKEGHSTRDGTYKITEMVVDKHSNRYGWIEDELGNVVDGDAKHTDEVGEGMIYVPAPMPYWMRLTNYGIGMHGGLIPEPGKPASHGCIRMPKKFVPLLYHSVKLGTPVTITHAPSTFGKQRAMIRNHRSSADGLPVDRPYRFRELPYQQTGPSVSAVY